MYVLYICVCVRVCEWSKAEDIQAGAWAANKRPKLQRLPCAEPPAPSHSLLFSSASRRSLTALKWSSLLFRTQNHPFLFASPTLYFPVFCTHKRGLHTKMHKKTYIPPSVSPPIASNFPPYPSFSLHAFLFSLIFPCWLAVRMVNPSWISGGYHHGDGALPHVSIDPPAG